MIYIDVDDISIHLLFTCTVH